MGAQVDVVGWTLKFLPSKSQRKTDPLICCKNIFERKSDGLISTNNVRTNAVRINVRTIDVRTNVRTIDGRTNVKTFILLEYTL